LDREILKNTIVNGDSDAAKSETQKALRSGAKATDVLDALVSGMNVVAKQFEDAEVYLPQVMVAADAMTAAVVILEPELAKSGATAKAGKVALGTVEGDIHDIGKSLVGIMLRGVGFDVIDLGRDTKVERFWETAKEHKCDLVVVSALMSTTTMNDKKVVAAGKESGLYPKVKVLIGGACTTPEFAEKIGALFGANAAEGARVALKAVGK